MPSVWWMLFILAANIFHTSNGRDILEFKDKSIAKKLANPVEKNNLNAKPVVVAQNNANVEEVTQKLTNLTLDEEDKLNPMKMLAELLANSCKLIVDKKGTTHLYGQLDQAVQQRCKPVLDHEKLDDGTGTELQNRVRVVFQENGQKLVEELQKIENRVPIRVDGREVKFAQILTPTEGQAGQKQLQKLDSVYKYWHKISQEIEDVQTKDVIQQFLAHQQQRHDDDGTPRMVVPLPSAMMKLAIQLWQIYDARQSVAADQARDGGVAGDQDQFGGVAAAADLHHQSQPKQRANRNNQQQHQRQRRKKRRDLNGFDIAAFLILWYCIACVLQLVQDACESSQEFIGDYYFRMLFLFAGVVFVVLANHSRCHRARQFFKELADQLMGLRRDIAQSAAHNRYN